MESPRQPIPGGIPDPLEMDFAEWVRVTIEDSPEAIFWMDESGAFTFVNRQACTSLGYSRDELKHLKLWDIDPDFPPERWATQWQELRSAGRRTFETRHRHRDGRVFPVEVCANHVSCGGVEYHTAFVRDITKRVQDRQSRDHLEAQLQQSQRLEAIGRLAGGVAHDFNNMLSVILGYTEQLLENTPPAEMVADLQQIDQAARRSADLTRQLLAFARRQTIAPQVLNLNEVVANLLKMLGRLMGEDIRLMWHPEAELARVKLDPAQVDQILANLCVNARDAIQGQGAVTIETANCRFDEHDCADNGDIQPGDYVMLAVSDDGCGMEPVALARVFEPFYTTKGEDAGTGLGLATVYGIVQQNRGMIHVFSEPGHGATFRIYLPAVAEESKIDRAPRTTAYLPSGHQTVMLVEDESAILQLATRQLQGLGYRVLAAESPGRALEMAEQAGKSVDLLVTDVVMPGLNGNELAARLQRVWPGMQVLYFSGYTANVIARQGVLDPGVHFLAKPYTLESLAVAVRRALEARRS